MIQFCTVKKAYVKTDRFYKKIGTGFNLLNKLYKTKYDYKKGEYVQQNYKNVDEIDEEYKKFIEEIYNIWTIGYSKALETAVPPILKSSIIISFERWWKEYIEYCTNYYKLD